MHTRVDDDGVSDAKIQIAGVSKSFFKRDGSSNLVIDDVNIPIAKGDFICLVGASGCGKTTLLRMIAGLISPTSGDVIIDGEPIEGPNPTSAFVFQADSLMPWRTVSENVGLGLEIRGADRGSREEAVEKALRMVRLDRWSSFLPHELSGGMRQRVNIARALAQNPDILLMDEPFAALDAQTREIMQNELLALCEGLKATTVFVTHQIEEAVLLADQIVVLSASPGRVREIVPVKFTRPREPGIKRSPEFTRLVEYVWGLIGDDVQKSLNDELGG